MLRRLWGRIVALWRLAKSERASPREIFWAVFLGVFAGCTPALGFHGWVAVGAATLFRKNRLFCWIGSRVSNILVLPFIVIAEIEVAHTVRTGETVPLDHEHIFVQAKALLLDWCLGTVPVGVVLGVLLGFFGWALARRRDVRRARLSSSPAPAPGRSSGSPA